MENNFLIKLNEFVSKNGKYKQYENKKSNKLNDEFNKLNLKLIKPCKLRIIKNNEEADDDVFIKCAGFNLINPKNENKDKIESIINGIIDVLCKDNDGNREKLKEIKDKITKCMQNITIPLEEFVKYKKKYKEAKKNSDKARLLLEKFYGKLDDLLPAKDKDLKIKEEELDVEDYEELKLEDKKLDKFHEKISDFLQNKETIQYSEKVIKDIEKNVKFSNNEKDYAKQIVEILINNIKQENKKFYESAQEKQKIYDKSAKGLKELKEIIKSLKNKGNGEIDNNLQNIIEAIELEHDYLIEKEKNDERFKYASIDSSELYKKFNKWIGINSISTRKLPTENDKVSYDKKEFENLKSGDDILIKIFGSKEKNWNPKDDDIEQGNIGDCYLLSALQSLCKTEKGKQQIRDCFINFEDIKDEECIKIQLHKLKVKCIDSVIKTEDNGEIIIKLDLSILTRIIKDNNNNNNNDVKMPEYNQKNNWVSFFEKAFAAYRNNPANVVFEGIENDTPQEIFKKVFESWTQKLNSELYSSNVDGGLESIAMSAITGKSCSNYFSGTTSDTAKLKNALDTAITNFDNPNLDKQNIFLSFEESKVKTLQKFKYLYSSHAYSIKSIDNGVATLKNPHNRQSYDLTVLPDDFFEKELKIQKIMLELLKFYIDPEDPKTQYCEIKINDNSDFKIIFKRLNITLEVDFTNDPELEKAFKEKFKDEKFPKIVNKLCKIAINEKSIDDNLTSDELYKIIEKLNFTFQWQNFKYKKYILDYCAKKLVIEALDEKKKLDEKGIVKIKVNMLKKIVDSFALDENNTQ